MTAVNVMRKRLLASRIGDFDNVPADELLRAAEETEAAMQSLGPFDPAYAYFAQRCEDFLKAAVIREAESEQ